MADGYGMVDFVVVSPYYPLQGDYGSIMDAINDGAVSIYVKSGIYVTHETITVPGCTNIYGESICGVIIDFQNEPWNFIINGFGVRISGLKVINSINTLGAFVFNAAEDATVEKCWIDHCDRATMFTASTFCHFSKNRVQHMFLESVFVDETSTDNRITDNRITDGQNYGIMLKGAWNKVVDNTIAGHQYDGILVVSKMNTIQGNTCNQNANGIYIAKEGGDDNSIVGNICVQNLGYGININSLENAGNVATTNVCKDNGVADVRFVPGNQAGFNDANTIV
jgi:parallel beta-helix repeat protein